MTLTPPASSPSPGTAPTVAAPPAKLVVDGLVKRYPVRRRDDVVAIDSIDLTVEAGAFTCIVGASGCGKSTLLNIVGGLEAPTAGRVLVEGELVVGPGPDRGMVFQAYSLFPWLSVADNIAFGLSCAGVDRSRRAERVDELLGIVGLEQWRDRLPKELSGGMRQRVAIARALAPEPDLLLLDEPFGALDAQTRLALHEFTRTVWQRTGATIVMVTHDVDEAVYLAQQVVVLRSHPGRVMTTIDVPFGNSRGPDVKRDPRFWDLRDEVQELLFTQHTDG
ncbi:MAG: ABC transporter ATP-binding protein [Acidimicrobiia bacterium]|nr:ABC transporter ATP-binding protein [Acidimicrobiia bacterium]